MRRFSATGKAIFLCSLIGQTGCQLPDRVAFWKPREPSPLTRSASLRLPVPTKDEVVLVDGRGLSIDGFISIRKQLEGATSEVTFGIAVAALALQNHAQSKGVELSAQAALDVSRYGLANLSLESASAGLHEFFRETPALPPASEVRILLDRLVSQSVIQRNPQVLAELH